MTPFEGPVFEAVGIAVLHALWQGVLIAAILGVTLRLLATASAAARYLVSCAALAALLLLGVSTAYRSYEPHPPGALIDAAPVTAWREAPADVAATPQEPFLLIETVRDHSATIALLWMAGVLVVAFRLAMSWRRTQALASDAVLPARAEWQAVVDRLARRLGIGRMVRLVEAASLDVPSVLGVLKPVVLVPASSLSGLSPRQLEMILAHELAHVRRHDYLVNLFQSVAETLLFFQPAAWWISRQIRIERENCCDDLAVEACGDAVEYARALAALEELRTAPTFAIAATGGSLLDRVRRLVQRQDGIPANGWTLAGAIGALVLVLSVSSLPLRADRDAPEPPLPPSSEIEVVAPPLSPVPPNRVSVMAPEPPEIAFDFDSAVDLDFDLDADVDIDLPDIPAPPVLPAVAPPAPPIAARPLAAPVPAVAPIARQAMAAAAAAAGDFDLDIDLDVDLDPERRVSDRPLSEAGRLSVDELIALRIHKITPEYVSEMRAIFQGVTIRQLTSMKALNITAQYVLDLRKAGADVRTVQDATSLRAMKVTPDFVRSLAAAGYSNLTVRELTRLAAAGVDAKFIRDLAKSRENK